MRLIATITLSAALMALTPRIVDAIAGIDFSNYELLDVQNAIDDSDFEKAIMMLEDILSFEPEDADALNLLGYCLRNEERNEEAMAKYEEALSIDPEHQGALEYQGELFLKLGDLAAAEANLEKLTALCPEGCEALATLETAIEKSKDGVEMSWVKPAPKVE